MIDALIYGVIFMLSIVGIVAIAIALFIGLLWWMEWH